jgi:hypothetical protein
MGWYPLNIVYIANPDIGYKINKHDKTVNYEKTSSSLCHCCFSVRRL